MEWLADLVKEGGLGAAALGILFFLIWWITKSLNGKLDRLTDAVKDLTKVMQRHVAIPLPDRRQVDDEEMF